MKVKYTKHGLSKSSEYCIWGSMITRCTNPKNKEWANYGGRGITVDPSWLEFANFYRDMGSRPSMDHTLDRKEGNGPYLQGQL